MTRKMLIVAISTLALTFGALALSVTADAQTACSYEDRIAGRCNNSIDGPTGSLTAPGSGAAGANATAGTTTTTTDAAATGSSNPNAESTIAFTGAESAVLGYVGAGMIGLGAVALVARRRMTETDEA